MFSKKFFRDALLHPFRSRPVRPIRKAAVFGRALESLEDRVVPTITGPIAGGGGLFTFNSDSGSDILQIQATATPNEILYNSGGIGLATLSGVTQIVFNGTSGNDTLVLTSPPNTFFSPSVNITFNGGGDAGDELAMLGGAANWTSTYNPTAVQAGSLSFSKPAGGTPAAALTQNIVFTGVPTIRNGMIAQSLAVTTPTTAADTINVFTGPTLGNIAAVQQGPVLIDGGDRDDHGSAPGGVNINGWKFIEQGMNFVMSNAFNSAPANSVLAIGVTGSQAMAAINSVATTLGYSVNFVTGAANIGAVNLNSYRVLYFPSSSSNTNGGINQTDLNAINARTTDVRDFINAGGGIFTAGTEDGLTNPYGWLQIPNPFTIAAFGGGGISDPLRKTPAAIAAGLTISDAELSAGVPYHNVFTGPAGFNNLLPFVLDDGPDNIVGNSDDRVVALGLGAIQNPGLGGAGPSTAITFGVNPSVSPQYPTMYIQNTPGLSLNGQGQNDAYNIQLGTPVLTNIAIAENGGSANDVATIYGTNGADIFNLNTAIANTLVWGSPTLETVSWTTELELLTLHSPAFPGEPNTPPALPSATDGADTFTVTPAVNTAITLRASNPVAPTPGYGDLLILNAMGLTGPVTLTNLSAGLPAMPDGMLSSGNRGTVTWHSIETVPAPLGLGGTFDFQPTRSVGDPHLQGNFHREVLPTDTLTNTSSPYYFPSLTAYAAGWVNPGQGAFNRATTFGPAGEPGGPLNKLLYDGEWGNAGSTTTGNVNDPNNGVFQVTVAANMNVMVTAYIGDMYYQRDNTNVYVGNSVVGFTKLNPNINTFTTASTPDNYIGYSGMFNPGNSTVLQVVVETVLGGTSSFWTISGLDVRPEGLINPLTLTRVLGAGQAGPLQANPLVADGLAVDYYHGTGALPGAVLTVNPQYGTVVDSDENAGNGLTADAYPKFGGFQVIADATGSFGFGVRRPTGIGPSIISVLDATGVSGTGLVGPNGGGGASATPNPYPLPSQLSQTFVLPATRRIDFGPNASLVAADSDPTNPNYLGVGSQSYLGLPANALGWVGTAAQTFDRAIGSALQRDGAYNTSAAPGDFMMDVLLPNSAYIITALLGDPTTLHDQLFISIVNPTSGMVSSTPVSGLTVPAGQSTSVTFTATSDANGQIRLRFGTGNSVTTAYWALQSLEVRPTQAALTITKTAPAGTPNADGTTVSTFSITGATPNAIITVATSLGTNSTTDGATSYTGIQVVASGAGTASFTITSPTSAVNLTSTITASETTGLKVGSTTQLFTGVLPPPPPAVPPAAVFQGFDFGTATSPLLAGTTRITGSSVYSPSAGYGWSSAVGDYDRTGQGVPPPHTVALFTDGVWGYGQGVFQVSVPLGSVTRDVRLYVGDPYYKWEGVQLVVEGNPTPAQVNTAVGWYGYVTASGSDANNDGVLNVTIKSASNSIWVAAGLEVAAVGALPAPITPAATTLPPAGLRLDLNNSSPTAAGFTGASGTAAYTPATGYGWVGSIGGAFDRGATVPTGLTAAQWDLYRDGSWGGGTGVFAVAVPAGAPNSYSARIYVGDSYANWGGITLKIEGNPSLVSVNTSANPFWTYLLPGGSDANGDGVLTITVAGPIWVVNGIDLIRSPGVLPASAGPAGSPQLAEGGAVAPGKASTLSADALAPLAAEAVRRWEAAGLSAAQLDALRGVQFEVTDLGDSGLLGLTSVGGNLIRIDDDGAGRGWFVDATPGNDAEFGSVVTAAERSGSTDGYDLLTVIMHEMGHTIGLDSLDASLAPSDLMTATLGTGTRRVPAAQSWTADAAVNLLIDEVKPVKLWANEAATADSNDAPVAAVAAAPAQGEPTPRGGLYFAPLATESEDDALMGVNVG